VERPAAVVHVDDLLGCTFGAMPPLTEPSADCNAGEPLGVPLQVCVTLTSVCALRSHLLDVPRSVA
jgi:hypothetical protein